jgi:hypothetical protein
MRYMFVPKPDAYERCIAIALRTPKASPKSLPTASHPAAPKADPRSVAIAAHSRFEGRTPPRAAEVDIRLRVP